MSTSNWSDHLPLKLVNVAVFVFLFGTNLYGSMSGHNHGWTKETYFTPASYAQYIWVVIDLLLLGYVIYQFIDSSHDAVHGVGWRFPLVGILNAIFLHVFVTGHYIVAFIFSLFVASTVSTVYYSLSTHYRPKNIYDVLFVHAPFSLWHAWSIVVVWISAFAAFTHGNHGGHPSVVVRVLVCIVLAVHVFVATGYAMKTRQGDILGALTIAFALFAIYDHQRSSALIHWFALGCFIATVIPIIKSLYFTFVANDGRIALGDDERAPLVA